MNENIIKISNLKKQYKKVTAITNLNLDIFKGEIIGLLGPNGAGKTTTIRVLMGLLKPTDGMVTVNGIAPGKKDDKLAQMIGYLPENGGFYDGLSVSFNLKYFAGFYENIDPDTQVNKYLKELDLLDKKDAKVGTLSKGLKQRVAIARALLHEPEIIILDEPTSGLDPEAANNIREKIKELQNDKRTIILSTHNLAEAELLCSKIAIIKNRLIKYGTITELQNEKIKNSIILKMENNGQEAYKQLNTLDYVSSVVTTGDTNKEFIIYFKDEKKYKSRLIDSLRDKGLGIEAFYEKKDTLEDIYLRLIKSRTNEKER